MDNVPTVLVFTLLACFGVGFIAYRLGTLIGFRRGRDSGYTLGRDTGYVDCQIENWRLMDRRFNHAQRLRNGGRQCRG